MALVHISTATAGIAQLLPQEWAEPVKATREINK